MDLQLTNKEKEAYREQLLKLSETMLHYVKTAQSGDAQARRAIKAGAQGYLLKNLLHKELLQTIRAVHAGRKAVAAEVAAQVAEHTGEEGLTPKEVEVLRLIASGNANKEIAARLSVSEETVKSRVKSILDKLGANDRTHAVTIALRRGIIDLSGSSDFSSSDRTVSAGKGAKRTT